MSSPQDPTHEIYRTGHNALSTVTQALEWYNTQMIQLKQAIKEREAKIDELTKKVEELQPNLKKEPDLPVEARRLIPEKKGK